jgi:hypothetical protein
MQWLTILALSLSLLICGPVWAENAPVATALTSPSEQTGKVEEDAANPATDIPLGETQNKVRLTIQVCVPRYLRASNQFTVYPYPVEPPSPHPKLTIGLLGTDDTNLKNALLTMGYVLRPKKEQPYPTCGYRMTYAYKNALKKYGGGQPHSMADLYRWRQEILPYFKYEILKSNERERNRMDRMDATRSIFANERADIETEAVKEGLYPVNVRVADWGNVGQRGQVWLPKARWWVVGTHKLPGLTFYWQEQVDLRNGAQTLQLHDGNALLIEGAW